MSEMFHVEQLRPDGQLVDSIFRPDQRSEMFHVEQLRRNGELATVHIALRYP